MQQSPANLIKFHLSKGNSKKAFQIYNQIRTQGNHQYNIIPPLLKACASLSLHTHGKSLHAETIKCGISSTLITGTTLISMYSKCHLISDSRKLFDEMPEKTVVTWNAMLNGYLRNKDLNSAMCMFEKMPMKSSVTWSEMIDGFARNKEVINARKLFDEVPGEMKNVVTWTVMVDGYVSNGMMEEARVLFEEMPERNCFVWSSMIAGYCKKGQVEEARMIFDRILVKNLVNWNALIAGYAQNGFCKEAFEALGKMQAEGFEPDQVTVASLLSACAQLGCLDTGKRIHEFIDRKGIKVNQFVVNGLVDMYAKCGDIANARRIFQEMNQRNTVCWNAMISGLAVHGLSNEALDLFRRMEESNEKPNEVTFLSVLSACAHGGFVNEGLDIFSKMKNTYGLTAGIEHYGCLIDLLGRGGRLHEAYNLIKKMPIKPNDVVWGALLGACRIHSEKELVEKVEREIKVVDVQMGARDDGHYVLLSNIYAASERWEMAERMRMMMVEHGIGKEAGCSSIAHGDK